MGNDVSSISNGILFYGNRVVKISSFNKKNLEGFSYRSFRNINNIISHEELCLLVWRGQGN